MMEDLAAASDWIMGFFIFIWRSPALAYWAQAGAILTTGLMAIFAARKAYAGALRQANATAQHTQYLENAELQRQQTERAAYVSAITAEILFLTVNAAAIRDWILDEKTLHRRFGYMYETVLLIDNSPTAVAHFGREDVFAIVTFYGQIKRQAAIVKDECSQIGERLSVALSGEQAIEFAEKHQLICEFGVEVLQMINDKHRIVPGLEDAIAQIQRKQEEVEGQVGASESEPV